MRLRKALGEMFPTPTFWHRHYILLEVYTPEYVYEYSNRGDIDHGKSAQGCVIYTPSYVEYRT